MCRDKEHSGSEGHRPPAEWEAARPERGGDGQGISADELRKNEEGDTTERNGLIIASQPLLTSNLSNALNASSRL